MSESAIQAAILAALGARPDVLVWRMNTGTATDTRTRRVVRFGTPGQADITGILAGGRRLEVEVKSRTGRSSPEQVAYARRVTAMGGLYVLARSAGEAVAAVEAALSEVPVEVREACIRRRTVA